MRAALLGVLSALAGCESKNSRPPIAADPAPSAASSVSSSPVMADSSVLVPGGKPVRVLAGGQVHPWGIAVDQDSVWWSNKGKDPGTGEIVRVSKAGGPTVSVRTGLDSPYGIALGDGAMAWGLARPGNGGFEWSRGSTLETVLLPGHEPWAMVIANGFLTFGDLGSRTLERVALGGDAAARITLATTKGRPVGLVVDKAFAYFTDSDPGIVAKVPLSGGPVVELVSFGDKTTGIAVDATHVYWSEWGSGRIAKVSKDGGQVTVLATDQKGARAIASDDQRVYFTHPPSGSIRSVAHTGGPVTVHATGQKHPYSVVIDATTIYWANVDGGTIAAVDR